MSANQILNHSLIYPSSQNSNTLLEHGAMETGGFCVQLSTNLDYLNLGKIVLEVKAYHDDSDIVDEFFELLEKKLNVLSAFTTDGDNEDLLVVWRTKPNVWMINEMSKCINSAWSYLTAFEISKKNQS